MTMKCYLCGNQVCSSCGKVCHTNDGGWKFHSTPMRRRPGCPNRNNWLCRNCRTGNCGIEGCEQAAYNAGETLQIPAGTKHFRTLPYAYWSEETKERWNKVERPPFPFTLTPVDPTIFQLIKECHGHQFCPLCMRRCVDCQLSGICAYPPEHLEVRCTTCQRYKEQQRDPFVVLVLLDVYGLLPLVLILLVTQYY
jgi:hypothetical protein